MTPLSPMPANPVFATPRLRGERFDQPQIPVEVLPALGIYRDLIFEIARRLVIARKGSDRAPKGFARSFTLLLAGIDKGSAVPVLVKKFTQSALDRDGWAEAFEDARDVVSDAVAAVNNDRQLPEAFPVHLLKQLENIGALLEKGEELVLEAPTQRKRKTASFGDATREKLAARTARIEKHRQFPATILMFDAEKGRFRARLGGGASVRGRARHEFVARLERALIGRNWMRAHFDAMVFVDGIGTIVDTDEVLSVSLVTCSSRAEVKAVEERFAHLDLLTPQGLDENPARAREFEWARDVILSLMVDTGLPRPSIYSSEEGVRAEWSNGKFDVSVDFTLPARAAYFHVLDTKTNEWIEQEFELGDPSSNSRTEMTSALKKFLPVSAQREVGADE